MVRAYQVEIEPDGAVARAEAGDNLREVLARHSVILTAPCGGKGTCKKCRVLVKAPDREVEEVLACQYRVHSDIRVTVPAASRIDVLADVPLTSEAIKTALSVEPASSFRRRKTPEDEGTSRLLGVAVDLGTTTVSAGLIDLETGEPLGFGSVTNQQTQFGADVITRIGYSQRDAASRKELSQALTETLRLITEALLSEAGSSLSDIHQIVFAGNTTMFATLLELDCTPLVTPPYSAPLVDSLSVTPQGAGALGELGLAPRARLDLLPAIGGYVGSDVLSGLLIATMQDTDVPFVFLDIGTNGEAVLASGEEFIASSAAAGPAFEGGEISCGMPAMHGAIKSVGFENGLTYQVIGGAKPSGICGSGLIDACASLVRSGAIEPSGRFCQKTDSLPRLIAERIGRKHGQAAFFFDENVWLTQEDIRKAQLAKSAIRTCIDFLLAEAQIKPKAIKRVLLGGAFGSFVDPQSAQTIGLIPMFESASKESLGNTSLAGAIAALLAEHRLAETDQLRAKSRYVNLAGRPEFQERFAANLAFQG